MPVNLVISYRWKLRSRRRRTFRLPYRYPIRMVPQDDLRQVVASVFFLTIDLVVWQYYLLESGYQQYWNIVLGSGPGLVLLLELQHCIFATKASLLIALDEIYFLTQSQAVSFDKRKEIVHGKYLPECIYCKLKTTATTTTTTTTTTVRQSISCRYSFAAQYCSMQLSSLFLSFSLEN